MAANAVLEKRSPANDLAASGVIQVRNSF